jgi:hypothetical protein
MRAGKSTKFGDSKGIYITSLGFKVRRAGESKKCGDGEGKNTTPSGFWGEEGRRIYHVQENIDKRDKKSTDRDFPAKGCQIAWKSQVK